MYIFILSFTPSNKNTNKYTTSTYWYLTYFYMIHYKTESEQNRCAMACQGCGAVFLLFLKKAVTGLSQDSIVKVRPITNFKHGLSPNNCL